MRAGRGLGGVYEEWLEKSNSSDDPGRVVLTWGLNSSSSYARYHVCQAICHAPHLFSAEDKARATSELLKFLYVEKKGPDWQLRVRLARHYCRQFECSAGAGNGEQLASVAWWMADVLVSRIQTFSQGSYEAVLDVIEWESRRSQLTWNTLRPATTSSALRYATLYGDNLWWTAMVSELSKSSILPEVIEKDGNSNFLHAEMKDLFSWNTAGATNGSLQFAFQGEWNSLTDRFRGFQNSLVANLAENIESCRKPDELSKLMRSLPDLTTAGAFIVSMEMRQQTMSGQPVSTLYDLFVEESWRDQILLDSDPRTVRQVLETAFEMLHNDSSKEWRMLLPHVLSLACLQTNDKERRELLFNYLISISLTTDTVSGIQRVLSNRKRGQFRTLVEQWILRLDEMSSTAMPHMLAKFRAIRTILNFYF